MPKKVQKLGKGSQLKKSKKRRKRTQPKPTHSQEQSQRQVVNIRFGDDKRQRRRRQQQKPQNVMNAFITQQSALTNSMLRAMQPAQPYISEFRQELSNINNAINRQNLSDVNPTHNFIDERIDARLNQFGNRIRNDEFLRAREDEINQNEPANEEQEAEDTQPQTIKGGFVDKDEKQFLTLKLANFYEKDNRDKRGMGNMSRATMLERIQEYQAREQEEPDGSGGGRPGE